MIERLSFVRPLIITVRDANEGGGQKSWSVRKRCELYRKFMPYATFIDIEASTVHLFADIIKLAKKSGVGIIISFHDFMKTPSSEELCRVGDICYKVGGDVFKIAVKVRDRRDLIELQTAADVLIRAYDFKVTTMAMGKPFGEISRYLDVISGGPFLYGFLFLISVNGQPNALQATRVFEKLGCSLFDPEN